MTYNVDLAVDGLIASHQETYLPGTRANVLYLVITSEFPAHNNRINKYEVRHECIITNPVYSISNTQRLEL